MFTGGSDLRRQLEAEERAYEPLPHGKTGDASFTTIPSQVRLLRVQIVLICCRRILIV